MTKTNPTDTSPTITESLTPADTAAPDAASLQSLWLLKDGTAPKLGARAEGSINYNVFADNDRQQLFIAITGNKGGGYFSKEHVDMTKIDACLDASTSAKPFPSKTFKEAFVGRSSNNAGFLVAVLRHEKLLAAAPEAETQHVRSGDWAAWKKSMLAETGKLIEIAIKDADKKPLETAPIPEHKEHTKTLTVPRKKSP
ncbi:hypothetical protein LPB67_12605 [Undibacterium sp. Jales W-56]|uniref:hypothetical protein n=1 Tax=Undibacterium sp. Jales W-56 TaxID=2897325 RepID=UPI0021D0E833|nr:hypothetical protein [Undibacterium sp. Jales W-56]MCU6434612.1 hypothetical protein [Undibacterium sp. Jales W-56]